MPILTDLNQIKQIAATKEDENDRFRIFLKLQDGQQIDNIVHKLNDEVTMQNDCTKCGNCCSSSLVSVTKDEIATLAQQLQVSAASFKEKYIEEGGQGEMIINKIPCHFLSGTKCSVYQYRFADCRDFPHLHKPNFTRRLFGTLLYYAGCPIIFNVVEKLKEATGFKMDDKE